MELKANTTKKALEEESTLVISLVTSNTSKIEIKITGTHKEIKEHLRSLHTNKLFSSLHLNRLFSSQKPKIQEGDNVLSVFDGLSGAQLALDKEGIKVNKYYASEVDEHAIKVTQANFPDTIQLGDVRNIKAKDLPKIDILVGGFPCQDLSSSKNKRKGLRGKKSKLFYEFYRLYKELKEINPNLIFILENVGTMKNKDRHIISSYLGTAPYALNSSFVSAQNRDRLYWTNIQIKSYPKNQNLVVADILETPLSDCCKVKYGLSYFEGMQNQLTFREDEIYYGPREDGIIYLGAFTNCRRIHDGKKLSRNFREGSRVYSIHGKSATLTAKTKGNQGGFSGLYGDFINGVLVWRQLTPVESERLQNIPDGYTDHVSETQRRKMIGNAFDVGIMAHILSFMKRSSGNSQCSPQTRTN